MTNFCLKGTKFFTHAFKVLFNSYMIVDTPKYIKSYMNVKYCVMHVHLLKEKKRNERRKIESPTRSRPFNSLTPQDQNKAYLKTKYGKKLCR